MLLLAAGQQLNGRKGKVVGQGEVRNQVQLEGGGGSAETLRFKPVNV
jgi:hypothetical protein